MSTKIFSIAALCGVVAFAAFSVTCATAPTRGESGARAVSEVQQAAAPRSSVRPQPSKHVQDQRYGLGAIEVTLDDEETVVGELTLAHVIIKPRVASANGDLSITLGPGLELVSGDAKEAVVLEEGGLIQRTFAVRRTADVPTSIAVCVRGQSAGRGTWSYSGGANMFSPVELRPQAVNFTSGDGRSLVGDR